MEKIGILIEIEKVTKASNGDLTCYLFILEDEVAHLAVTDPIGILTIEKQFQMVLRLLPLTRKISQSLWQS